MNILISIVLFLCTLQLHAQHYKTKYIIVLVVDGPRYSETWGDSTHKYIPNMVKMSKEGVIHTNFYNDRFTYTSSGHTALTTGYAQAMENVKGTQLPDHASYMQYYLQKTGKDSTAAFLITSKDKLAILSNTVDTIYHNRYRPAQNCGNGGKGQGSGYRVDSITCRVILQTLKNIKPDLVFANFREPDFSGHACSWNNYLKGIRDTDSLVYEIFKFINTDRHYKGKTTLLVTNDHGRHLDGLKEGFCEHGDSCLGCEHINLFAYGPDFKKNYISAAYGNQTDLTATVAVLLGLQMPYSQGKILKDLFK
jgi:hypothetical protein